MISLYKALTGLTCAALFILGESAPNPGRGSLYNRQSNANGTCPAPKDIPVRAAKASPFKPLTEVELSSITEWLYNPENGLNLTDSASETLSQTDNYIFTIEALFPNKTDVLAYLDGNKTSPERYARVVINEGGKLVPDVTDYWFGPLPIGKNTTLRTLDYFYNGSPRVPFNGRVADGPRTQAVDVIVTETLSSIADITLDLTGLVYYGRSDNRTTLTYFMQNPTSMDGSSASFWCPIRAKGLASYDRLGDLYLKFDVSGSDSATYKLELIVYDVDVFTNIADFRAAWEAGELTKVPPANKDSSWLKKDREGAVRDLEDRLAPVTMELQGKRYKIDDENKYIEYLGWSFYTRFDLDVGIQFFDIKFKGERVLYELSLQDAVAQYYGNNPFSAATAYNDRFYGIGGQAIRMIPGYDCPYHASYLNATFTSGESIINTKNAICIFESDIGYPITRHTDYTYAQATKGSMLTVRMIATVGNYDYLWDYTFYVDGTIGVDAHASGYIQGNYYRPSDNGHWGPRIQNSLAGALHTHVMNFKADFDIVDAKNTFLKTEIIVENITQPWFPELGKIEMARFNFTELANEDDGLLPVPSNGQTMYTVINKDKLNEWGEPRGYRIVPGLSNIHLAPQNSPFFLKSAQASKQAFAVCRQHDTEPSSSSTLNQNMPMAPPVEFYKFFDGEDLIQQDIVTYFNLGMHHYTRSEDLPNTLMTGAHSSITFAPQNWGNTELTRDLTNAVIYNTPDGFSGEVEPFTNGVNPPACFPRSADDELLGVFLA